MLTKHGGTNFEVPWKKSWCQVEFLMRALFAVSCSLFLAFLIKYTFKLTCRNKNPLKIFLEKKPGSIKFPEKFIFQNTKLKMKISIVNSLLLIYQTNYLCIYLQIKSKVKRIYIFKNHKVVVLVMAQL